VIVCFNSHYRALERLKVHGRYNLRNDKENPVFGVKKTCTYSSWRRRHVSMNLKMSKKTWMKNKERVRRFKGAEERWYGEIEQDLMLITLDRHESFQFGSYANRDKRCKQRQSQNPSHLTLTYTHTHTDITRVYHNWLSPIFGSCVVMQQG